MTTTTAPVSVEASVVEPIEMNWFQKMIAKIMAVISKLLLKFGIRVSM